MNIKRIIISAFLAVSTVVSLTACAGKDVSSSDSTESLRTLRVAHMTGMPDQYAAYIGTKQGIFEKYGIKLDTTEFATGMNTIDSVLLGNADTGFLADFAAANRIGNTLHDTHLVIFSDFVAGSSGNSGGIYVAPQYADNIQSLDGSEGWITTIGTVSEYYNWQAQKYLGLDPANQKIVQSNDNMTALALAQNGGASAMVVSGMQVKRFEEVGWVKVADRTDAGIDVYYYLVSTKEFVDENSEMLADYLKALKESYEYINANFDSAAADISSKFGLNEEDFKSEWKLVILSYGLTEDGADHLNKIKDWAFENGKIPEDYDIKEFYNTKAVDIAFPNETDVDLSSIN